MGFSFLQQQFGDSRYANTTMTASSWWKSCRFYNYDTILSIYEKKIWLRLSLFVDFGMNQICHLLEINVLQAFLSFLSLA